MSSRNLLPLTFKSLGLDTQQELVVYMRRDSQVFVSEGFETLTRVQVACEGRKIVATLHSLHSSLLQKGEISLSESAKAALNCKEGDEIYVYHLPPLNSLRYLRSKIYGKELSDEEIFELVEDMSEGRLSDIHLSAFITACSGSNLSLSEIESLTKAMINTGESMHWKGSPIVDKHCIGGLPGNRTTPIVVSICAAAGLTMPKTSSRAITSPAGTADTMEVMAPVSLTLSQIERVIEKEGGCVVWGGKAKLSPADDILIRVERALDIDSEGQLIASVLSKKKAAGSTHVVIDMPVGDTAKIRSMHSALQLQDKLIKVGASVGMKIRVLITDGTQPVGMGIGPALEAIDVLKVLRTDKDAPQDLRKRALSLASELLEISGVAEKNEGLSKASSILDSGQAYRKFQAICQAQGGFTEPKLASFFEDVYATQSGVVEHVDNRKLAKIAKLAGAPERKSAGLQYFSHIGKQIRKGDILFRVYAENKGELDYAMQYVESENNLLQIKPLGEKQ